MLEWYLYLDKVLKKEIEAKDAQINGLELRMGDLEKVFQSYKKHQEKKVKEIKTTNENSYLV